MKDKLVSVLRRQRGFSGGLSNLVNEGSYEMKNKLFSGASPSYVIVRTFSAGVHTGLLIARDGKEVELSESRRIWSWEGAMSLSEIAVSGVGPDSRLGVPVSIILTEAIEIIAVTPAAEKNLRGFGECRGERP